MKKKTTDDGLTVIMLSVQNFTGLRAVEIRPASTGLIPISGANGAGKSSVLNSIAATLTGKLPPMPVRAGADEATLEVDLGDYVVRRRIVDGKTARLEVAAKDGQRYGSPQKFLDELLGELSFDPIAFVRLKAKEQRDVCLRALGLDFEAFEQRRRALYDERTQVGRVRDFARQNLEGARQRFREAKAPIEAAGERFDGPVDVDELRVAFAALEASRADYAIAVAGKERRELALSEARRRVADLKAALVEAEDAENAALDALLTCQLPEPPNEDDAEDLRSRMRMADAHNAAAAAADDFERLERQAKAEDDRYEALTRDLAVVDKDKADALAEADFPVDGLEISDDGLSIGGIPFAQVQTSRQIAVSTAIAMAANPNVRVILVREGSLLDSGSLDALETVATEHGFQVWIERVDGSGEVGFYVEDGTVVAAYGEEVRP